MLVSLPNPLTDGTTAFGSHVKGNDDAIVTVLNGGVDNDNMRTNADAAGKGLTSDKLANNAIITAKIADGQVTAPKLSDDVPLGSGANLSELWTGSFSDLALGYPATNVNASRQQHGGKTIWTYFSIAVANINVNYLIDNSVNWNDRLIFLVCEATVGAAVKSSIPGGAGQDAIAYPFWTGTGSVGTGGNGGMFYSYNGQDGTAGNPALSLNFSSPTPDTIRWFVGNGSGGTTAGHLYVRATAILGTGISINAMISCSPNLGTA